MIDPGESVGIIAAMAIGEKQTQNVLNTFHKAGQNEKSVTTGMPRFQELLNATRSPKVVNCKIYFNEGNSTIHDLRNTINHQLVCLKMKDLAVDIKININKEEEWWYESFETLYNNNFRAFSNCLTLTLNKKTKANCIELSNGAELIATLKALKADVLDGALDEAIEEVSTATKLAFGK
jgi:DNA-directed RNA polymerase beta' subunit